MTVDNTISIFQEVSLAWAGKEYSVKPNQVMELVERIEDFVTLEELNGTGLKRVKIAKAFHAALNFAGASASLESVYNSLFDAHAAINSVAVVKGLLCLMIPPEHLRESDDEAPNIEGTASKKKPRKKAKKISRPA